MKIEKRAEEVRRRGRAYGALHYALSINRIARRDCEVCGSSIGVDAHHDDYDKPLDVVWLCRKHHKDLHRDHMITKEMIDRKIKSIRHLLIDHGMLVNDLIEETGIKQRQLAQAMMGKNIQLWAFTVLSNAEKHLINRSERVI